MKPDEEQLKTILSKVADKNKLDYKEVEMIYDVLIRSMNKASTVEGGLKKILIQKFCSFDIPGHVWHRMAVNIKGKQNRGVQVPHARQFWILFEKRQNIRKSKKELDKRRVTRIRNEKGEWIKLSWNDRQINKINK